MIDLFASHFLIPREILFYRLSALAVSCDAGLAASLGKGSLCSNPISPLTISRALLIALSISWWNLYSQRRPQSVAAAPGYDQLH